MKMAKPVCGRVLSEREHDAEGPTRSLGLSPVEAAFYACRPCPRCYRDEGGYLDEHGVCSVCRGEGEG